MGIPVLILGESGSGKTFSCRNLDPRKVAMFQVTNKPLPFRAKNWHKSIRITHDWRRIIEGVYKCAEIGKEIIIIDDFQYILAEEFLQRSGEKGFSKFTELAVHAREVIRAAQDIPFHIRVYLTWHTEIDDHGIVKAKTIGKLLNEKITIEGLFTIVLRAQRLNGIYQFSTQANNDVCKSPFEMFSQEFIDNDIDFVDKSICDFYGIGESCIDEKIAIFNKKADRLIENNIGIREVA